jgi:hypothetical protein
MEIALEVPHVDWSYKENSAAQHYMTLQTGEGVDIPQVVQWWVCQHPEKGLGG